jgi:hypothetical protein
MVGARFSMIELPAHGDRPPGFVLKRTSPAIDWIAAAGDTEPARAGAAAASSSPAP